MTQVCAVYGVRATVLLHMCHLCLLHEKVSRVVFTTLALLVTSSQSPPLARLEMCARGATHLKLTHTNKKNTKKKNQSKRGVPVPAAHNVAARAPCKHNSHSAERVVI